ncbi:hypothetical protein NFI96_000175, partial [Prochilodus magdalenae]
RSFLNSYTFFQTSIALRCRLTVEEGWTGTPVDVLRSEGVELDVLHDFSKWPVSAKCQTDVHLNARALGFPEHHQSEASLPQVNIAPIPAKEAKGNRTRWPTIAPRSTFNARFAPQLPDELTHANGRRGIRLFACGCITLFFNGQDHHRAGMMIAWHGGRQGGTDGGKPGGSVHSSTPCLTLYTLQ